MWLLYENDEVVYRLLASPASSQEIKIGRSQQCDIVLHDNVRLSRVCATVKASVVKINSQQASADKATYTLTVTDTSKLGIQLNGEPVTSKSSQSILSGDVLQIVGDESQRQYTFRWHGMLMCESAISAQQRSIMTAATAATGCMFTKQYSEACTHVLLGKHAPTPKVIHAIIDQKPVVTVQYLQQLTSSDHIREPLPSPADLMPLSSNDASVQQALTIAAQPDGKQRHHLLEDKSIVFALQKSYNELDSVTRAVGSRQSVVARLDAEQQWWQELGDFVVVQPTVSKRSLQASQVTQAASQMSHNSAASDVASLIAHLRQQGILDETDRGLTDEKVLTSAIVLADIERIDFTRVQPAKRSPTPAEVITLDDSTDIVQPAAEQFAPSTDDHTDVQSVISDTTADTIVLDVPAAVKAATATAASDKVNSTNKFAASPPDEPADHSVVGEVVPKAAAEQRSAIVEETKQSLDPFDHTPPVFAPAAATPLKAALESVDDQVIEQTSKAQPARRSGNRFAPSMMSQKRKSVSNADASKADSRASPSASPPPAVAKVTDVAVESDDDDTGWGVIPAKPKATDNRAKQASKTSSDESKESQPLKRKNGATNNFTSSKRRSMVDGMTLNAFGLGSPMPQASGDELMGGSEPRNDRSNQDQYDFAAPSRQSTKTASQPSGNGVTQNVKKFRKQWPKGYTPPSSAGE